MFCQYLLFLLYCWGGSQTRVLQMICLGTIYMNSWNSGEKNPRKLNLNFFHYKINVQHGNLPQHTIFVISFLLVFQIQQFRKLYTFHHFPACFIFFSFAWAILGNSRRQHQDQPDESVHTNPYQPQCPSEGRKLIVVSPGLKRREEAEQRQSLAYLLLCHSLVKYLCSGIMFYYIHII